MTLLTYLYRSYNPTVLKNYLTENHDQKDQGDKNGSNESNILVALRVRPIIQKEVEKGDFNIARVEDNLIVSVFMNFMT